jgi:hypothetical protein
MSVTIAALTAGFVVVALPPDDEEPPLEQPATSTANRIATSAAEPNFSHFDLTEILLL